MVSGAEGAHELTDFTLLCIFCSTICSSDDQVESVKKVLDEQKCALFTRLAIGQQSPYLNGIDRRWRGDLRSYSTQPRKPL